MNLRPVSGLGMRPSSQTRLLCPLGLASILITALVALELVRPGGNDHASLLWNLFLAWVPVGLAASLRRWESRYGLTNWRVAALALGWLLFLPNAPYLFTDLVHLGAHGRPHFWADLILLQLLAWTGLMLGWVSLNWMHLLVTERFGRVIGWSFVAVVTGLCGWGIYIGRFLRWNSWDVIVNPLGLMHDLAVMIVRLPSHPLPWALAAFFGVILCVGYLTVYALAYSPRHTREQCIHRLTVQRSLTVAALRPEHASPNRAATDRERWG